MVIFLNDRGEIITSAPVDVGRNSVNANEMIIVAPADSALASAVVYTAFRLPNGVEVFGGLATDESGSSIPAPADSLGVNIPKGQERAFVAWRQPIGSNITRVSGIVGYTIYCVTESAKTSATGTFLVSRATTLEIPTTPPTVGAWEQIATAIAQIQGDLSELRADVGDWSDPEREESLRAAVEAAEADIAENAENIARNTESIDQLRADVGTRPRVGYTGSDTLWSVIGERPPVFGRETIYDTLLGIADDNDQIKVDMRDLLDEVGEDLAEGEARLEEMERKVRNLDAANRGFTYVEQKEELFASSFQAPAAALPFGTLDRVGGVSTLGGSEVPLELMMSHLGGSGTFSLDFDLKNTFTVNGQSTIDTVMINIFNVNSANRYKKYRVNLNIISGSANGKFAIAGDAGAAGYYEFPASGSHSVVFHNTVEWDSGWPIDLCFLQNVTYSNLKIEISIFAEPYTFSAAGVSEIRREGVNLLPNYPKNIASTQNRGVSFTMLSDGGIHIQGQATGGNARLDLTPNNVGMMIQPGTYAKSPNYIDGKGFVFAYVDNGVTYFWSTGSRAFNYPMLVKPYIQVTPDAGPVDEIIYPILASGTQVPNFELPGETYSFAIPASVQALPGYGVGASPKACNQIVFETVSAAEVNATYERRVRSMQFTFSGAWDQESISADLAKVTLDFNQGIFEEETRCKPDALAACNRFTYSANPTQAGEFTIRGRVIEMLVPAEWIASTAWQAKLNEWASEGAPLEVIYEADQVEKTDVTSDFADGNTIRMAGSNSYLLEFITPHRAPAPIDLTLDERS